MKDLFQTTGENPIYSLEGNNKFRSGWKKSRLGEKKKKLVLKYLQSSDVHQVYKRGRNIYVYWINGVETQIG